MLYTRCALITLNSHPYAPPQSLWLRQQQCTKGALLAPADEYSEEDDEEEDEHFALSI